MNQRIYRNFNQSISKHNRRHLKCQGYVGSSLCNFHTNCLLSRFSSRFSCSSSTTSSNLSVAIVGSGPSGFYSAKYLQLALQRTKRDEFPIINELNIDLIERLPTPFGLVRSGVAPDHPEVKNVENDFVSLIEKSNGRNNAENEADLKTSLEFRGNVEIGKDVSLHELRDLYDVVILAYGCDSDKKLGIEIDNHHFSDCDNDDKGTKMFQGIYSAREFVAWYNGHPDYAHMGETFQKLLGDGHPEKAEVVVIGQGEFLLTPS